MYRIHHADCFDWLRDCRPHSVHAVCTDPPYGLLEFTEKEVSKLRAGRGGVWRLPSWTTPIFVKPSTAFHGWPNCIRILPAVT